MNVRDFDIKDLSMDGQQNLFNLAKDLFQNKKYPESIEKLHLFLKSTPDHVEGLFLLANIYYIVGEVKKSITYFQKVLQLDLHHTEANIGLSVIYNDIGQYDKAKSLFKNAESYVEGPQGVQGLKDPHINKIIAKKHMELGDLYLRYQRFDEALMEYEKAIKLDPKNLFFKIKKAKAFAKGGFIAKAFEELRTLKRLFPEFIPGRVSLGLLFYSRGQVLEAQNEWKTVLSKDPENKDALMYIKLSQSATETQVQI